MNLRPLHDRVIVKRLDQETKTASGIVIPKPLLKSRIKARSLRSARASVTTRAPRSRST